MDYNIKSIIIVALILNYVLTTIIMTVIMITENKKTTIIVGLERSRRVKINSNNLNLALAKSCISLKTLSEISNVNKVTLTRIIKGVQEPRPQTIGKIAKALNVDVTELIDKM